MSPEKESITIKNKVIWIDPHTIKLFSPPPNWWWYARLEKRIKNKKIKKLLENIAMGSLCYGGGWDLSATLFENSDWVKKIKTLTPNYKHYQLSFWYKSIISEIKQQGFYKHKQILIKNEKDANYFFENYLGKLIQSLVNNGYVIDKKNSNDVPKVLIARNGDLIKSGNGCHRLAIIQKLELQCKYPVKIIGIHKEFNINGVKASFLKFADINLYILNKFGY